MKNLLTILIVSFLLILSQNSVAEFNLDNLSEKDLARLVRIVEATYQSPPNKNEEKINLTFVQEKLKENTIKIHNEKDLKSGSNKSTNKPLQQIVVRQLSVNTTMFSYIYLPTFSTANINTLHATLTNNSLFNQNIILDLRGNQGDTLNNYFRLLTLFYTIKPDDTIEFTTDKRLNKSFSTDIHSENTYTTIEKHPNYFILINQETASAAAGFASKIREKHSAILIGEPTHKNGVIETVQRVNDSIAVRVPVAYLIGGNSTIFHGIGIEPDYAVNAQGCTEEELIFPQSTRSQCMTILEKLLTQSVQLE